MTMPGKLAYSHVMPEKISKTYEVQIIGGIFSSCGCDHAAMEDFQDLDIPQQNIQVVVKIDSKQTEEAYTRAVVRAIRNGNILVSVHNAAQPASIMEVRALPA